jgi:hypothetical protein
LIVTGTSGTSNINFGTCRALKPLRIAVLSWERSAGVREGMGLVGERTTKRKTVSSGSEGRRRPTQRVLVKMVLKGGDSVMA